MSTLSKKEAVAKIATVVEAAKLSQLTEIYSELFPGKIRPSTWAAKEIASYIRNGLEAEEVVDLWNVVFPMDRNVWYNESDRSIHINEELVGAIE